MYTYLYGAGKVFSNTSQASPAPERYHISNTLRARKIFKYTSPAPLRRSNFIAVARALLDYNTLFGDNQYSDSLGLLVIYWQIKMQIGLQIVYLR